MVCAAKFGKTNELCATYPLSLHHYFSIPKQSFGHQSTVLLHDAILFQSAKCQLQSDSPHYSNADLVYNMIIHYSDRQESEWIYLRTQHQICILMELDDVQLGTLLILRCCWFVRLAVRRHRVQYLLHHHSHWLEGAMYK